ncbi:MAG TPA: STAS domain-containing protein [Candidatus Acidoferrum sp.]|nr:STAS domain-containing protein [Candidatus Acidoferrum sp.]
MEVQPEDGALIVQGVQELDAAALRELREAVDKAVASGVPVVAVDLSGVAEINATGLGVLASLYRFAVRRLPLGLEAVRLLDPQFRVRQMLELARIDLLFEIITTRKEQSDTETASTAEFLEAA